MVVMLSSSSKQTSATLDGTQRSLLIELARKSIQHGLQHNSPLKLATEDYDATLQAHKASFVTLNLFQQLRGCIGTLSAYRPLVLDVVDNAYNAAFRDPRFSPLSTEELAPLDIHISVLSTPQRLSIESEEELLTKLRPGIDGLIIKDGVYQATFLPSVWQSLATPHEFLAHLKYKAGLPGNYWSDTLEAHTYQSESFGE